MAYTYSEQTWDTLSIYNPTRMNYMENGIRQASTASTYEIADTINLDDFVAMGFLRGNRKRVDFVIPVNKDISSASLTLTGNWSFYDLSDNTVLVNEENINATGNTVSLLKKNGFILVQINKADNIGTSRMGGIYLSGGAKITIS